MLKELPFYNELNKHLINMQKNIALKYYLKKVILQLNYQLEARKSVIKDLFKDLLDKMNGFKYQITLKVTLSKHKVDSSIEYSTVYFNFSTKTVVKNKHGLDKSFQQVLYRIDNWINEGSAWKIESKDGEYINTAIYNPLSGSTYTELPDEKKFNEGFN